jgi:hypothetical protein
MKILKEGISFFFPSFYLLQFLALLNYKLKLNYWVKNYFKTEVTINYYFYFYYLILKFILGRSVDEETVGEIKQLTERISTLEGLLNSALIREQDEREKKRNIISKLQTLQEVIKKKDEILQSNKMALKFRESRIQDILNKNENSSNETEIILMKEITELRRKVEQYSDIPKFALENLELRGTLFLLFYLFLIFLRTSSTIWKHFTKSTKWRNWRT